MSDPPSPHHVGGHYPGIELLRREVAGGNGGFPQAEPLTVGPLGYLGRLVVTDVRVECRDQHQGAGQQLVYAGPVGCDAGGTVIVEALHAVGQQTHTL